VIQMTNLSDFRARIRAGEPIFAQKNDVLTDWGVGVVMAPVAWKVTKGKGVKVALLDTGVDTTHPDLVGRILAGINFTGGDMNDFTDRVGHGTHCAGIICGSNNGQGVIGVAPEANLLVAKVLGDDGSGGLDAIYKGMQWAIQQGADLISMSLGCEEQPPEEFHAIFQQAINAGIPVVVAAGNENHGLDWPAAYPETISVGAVDEAFQHPSFSNYGATLDVAAPGVDIFSTWPGGKYAILSGTSMATPMVAGCIALLLAKAKAEGRKLSVAEVTNAVRQSAVHINTSVDDPYMGAGLINCAKLIQF
jgi:subtilisin family serine protease